ncbi:3-oxoacyl-ACP reductase [Mycolicibacter sp. MYC123]|uniref:3-oxoacyl-ACP reductase n=1 Tax=[Mycobacterium] zoologicum TaxID=2872311 RepID=A0ABU5YEF0_9MYCO|nr:MULTISPECIES: 3-oxoacyl-ACP reductase [unclassified Mycolicibacter]MEB3048266.1 3-oxoacyl-ACP reductase [Mycolicibacter sp. MYC123]MEB3064995.1 3-oxoacyl-ACP reductase [Mycolicibacter sp. MYC101]
MTDNSIDLSGKVAVVTGAAAGLGRAEAIGLARSGATVVVNDIAPALESSDVIDEIAAAGGKGVPVAGDISQRSTADDLVSTADGLGGLNIVVNNAGITRDRMLFNMSDEDFDAVIAVHLRGHFLLTRNAAAYFRQKGKESADGTVYGRIVNTSSEAGLMGPVGQANYGAAKAGITALTLSASRALSRYGVTANAICPRARTAMTADVFGAAEVAEGEIDPLSPEHVVTLVRFLASPASASVSGQVFVVYGPEVTLMAAPTVERKFSADGQAWDPAGLSDTLAGYFAGRDPGRTFSASELMAGD